MKEILKKTLTSKAARSVTALTLVALVTPVVARPWQ